MKKIFPVILLILLCAPVISFSEGYSNKPAVYTGTIFSKPKSPAEIEPAAGEATPAKPAKMEPIYSGRYKKPSASGVKPAAKKTTPVYTRPAGRVAKTIFSTTTTGQRVLVTFNNRPRMKTAKNADGTITFFFQAPVTYTAPKIPKAFQKNFLKVQGGKAPNGNLIITIQHDPAKTAEISFAASMILVDVITPQKAEREAEEKKPEPAEAPKEIVKKEEKKPEVKIPPVQYIQEGEVEKLRFEFSKPVSAAVFSRFGYYWLVFDSAENREIPEEIKMSEIFQTAEKIPTEGAQVFSLTQSQEAYATATQEKNAWIIEFDSKSESKIDRPMKLDDSSDFYKIPAAKKGRRIDISDHHVGDKLVVIPFSEAGYGVETAELKTNFALEKSTLGIVIKQILPPLDINLEDKMIVRIAKDGKNLPKIEGAEDDKKEAKSEEKQEVKKIDPKDLKPLFKFEKWPQLTTSEFDTISRKLRADNFEYGKFLFTQGLYAEASTMLKRIKGFQAQFLSAASFYMMGRYGDSSLGLDRLVIADDMDKNEFLLWKAAANHKVSYIQPQLSTKIDMSNFSIPLNFETYPDNIKHRLLIDLAELYIDSSKPSEAQNYINMLPKSGLLPQQTNYRDYLQGRIFALQGKNSRAYELWSNVVSTNSDRESRAKSRYEIVMLDLASNKLKKEQVIEVLDGLRIVWRGDMFEYNLLYKLAELNAKNKNEVAALRIYREMLSNFPRFPKNEEAASKMQDLFNTAMERSLGKKEGVFEAITIYYEFEELKPVGKKGDEVTIQLAEALTKFDLLSEAAALLSKYSESKKDVLEKAEIETRVAVLHFLNGKFKEVGEVLNKEYSANEIPNYLTQERQIILARSLIELGDYKKANEVIAKLPAEMFFRFKTDILWKQKKWSDVVDSYKYVTDKTEDDLMKLAVAYALTGNDKALEAMRTSYLDKMKKSRYAKDFEFITDTKNLDYRNLAGSLKLPDTEKLIESYKKKIQRDGLSSVAATPVESKPNAEKAAPKKVE